MPSSKKANSSSAKNGKRIYVVDTSVLLSDPSALLRFAEHEVVLPIVVIAELEAKRHHLELGYFARESLRLLDDIRVKYGRLDISIPINDQGGTLRVELNHVNPSGLPEGFRYGDNDSRILAVALNLKQEGKQVVLVTKDLPMRVKASVVGLEAEEYRAELPTEVGWTGMVSVNVDDEAVSQLYDKKEVSLAITDDIPVHSGIVLHSPSGSALARKLPSGAIRLVRNDREVFGIHGRSAEQRVALDLLMDDDIGIVSLGGQAGTGKSALALSAGLELVLEKHKYAKVMVFRPLYAVGGQEIGYLPGTVEEKMAPWGQAVFDVLSSVTSKYVIDEITSNEMIEVLPLTHIRGRSLHDAFVIVDEAQSLERNVLLTVLSRIGKNSRVVLTHDVAQRDNLRIGRYDGVVAVVEKLKGHELFAHVTLTRSERSKIAELVTELLGKVELNP